MSDDYTLLDNHDIDRFDEVGYSIAKMGQYFVKKGYDPKVVAKKMEKNAELFKKHD